VDDVAGTLHFLAPECLEHRGSTKSDYWSLGVILFRLCTGTFPHQHGTHGQLLHRIRHGYIRWRKLPQNLPYLLLDLIRGLLERDPEKRYGAKQLRVHPFLSSGANGWKGQSCAMESEQLYSAVGPLRDPRSHIIRRQDDAFPPHKADRQAVMTIVQARKDLRMDRNRIGADLQPILGTPDDVEEMAKRDLDVCDSVDALHAAAQTMQADRSGSSQTDSSSEDSERRPLMGALRSASSDSASSRPGKSSKSLTMEDKQQSYWHKRQHIAAAKAASMRQSRNSLPSEVRDSFDGAGSDAFAVPQSLDEEER